MMDNVENEKKAAGDAMTKLATELEQSEKEQIEPNVPQSTNEAGPTYRSSTQ